MWIFGHHYAWLVGKNWCHLIEWLAEKICGISYRVEGLENFPDEACVTLMKHSSSYETFIQNVVFPRSCWVLKKELIYVPFFGWTMIPMKAIAIDRSAGRKAVQQVIEQGKERLAIGLNVSIFPEGTRMPPGETKRYGRSGVLLAQEAGCKIVPIAHNAGYHWPRGANRIEPGVITFVIGEPIDPAGRDGEELNKEIQDWIEGQITRIQAAENSADND